MPSDVEAFLQAWHAAARTKDARLVAPFTADEVQLSSPAFYRPKQGKAEVLALLQDVAASLSSYRVTKTWIDGAELLLEFDAEVGARSLQGVDRISLDAQGRMVRLKVLVRPLSGLRALAAAVGERQLARLGLPARIAARARMALRRGARG
jgi:hypothetical protein